MSTHADKATKSHRKTHKVQKRPPFECIALLLQGGGALGAYQAGVYQALAEANLHPDWVAGISIGGINSAIIAGNAPERRAEALKDFWEHITSAPLWRWSILDALYAQGDFVRGFANQFHAGLAAALGVSGFFSPRNMNPWLRPAGAREATSYYDTSAMKTTLEQFVDFDRINSAEMRFSVGAVNVATGNFVYFDNTTHAITPEHVMASAALPPGFPAIEID